MTIEEYVIAQLGAVLTEPVSGDIPSPLPARFVTVEQTGGGHPEKLGQATLAVQSWAKSRAEAGTLCETVIAAMEALAGKAEISSVELTNKYNFPDTSRRRPRYQAVFDIVHYL